MNTKAPPRAGLFLWGLGDAKAVLVKNAQDRF